MIPWKPFRHQLEELGSRLLTALIPRISRRGCVRLGRVLGLAAYACDARGRAVAVSNLECVFGERLSPAERHVIIRASYQNFARTMIDLFWSSRLTPANFRDYLRLEGFDELQERLAGRKEGAVFFCVHQGNWEWASLAFGFLGLQTSIVAQNFKNSRLTDIFSARREVSGHKIIAQENSVIRLLKVCKRGGWAGLLIDLSLRPSQASTILEAFEEEGGGVGSGLEMCVPLLHAVLARRAGAMLIPVETEPLPDGTCRVRALPPVEWPEDASLQDIAQRCWKPFEPILRARPGEWLWAYKHFRYKPRQATRPYPPYAHASGKYEKLRREVFSDVG